LLACENTTDRRSYIKYYKFSNNDNDFVFERQTMFADPVKSLVEVDKSNGMVVVLFEKAASGFALAKTDFDKCTLTIVQTCY